MIQMVLNIEDKSLLPSLRKILSKLEGVTIHTPKTHKSGLDRALEDVEAGHVYKADNVDELFKQILD